EMFLRVSEIGDYDGKIVAVKARDTLKEVADSHVVRTINRSIVWHAQTPQAFRRKILLECHFRARSEGFLGTDDASLLERYGYKVGIVEGSFWNVKVTYPEDLEMVKKLLCG
ncbi:MAG: 2-C-methyl-D-erythritol 4-phosphate cytidylyltransferase, partial [Aquificae bacterium]|nr:2-C-methyl-D-erythritol 4-phosphate cytidylyltransferase [Aquificota bacterium]